MFEGPKVPDSRLAYLVTEAGRLVEAEKTAPLSRQQGNKALLRCEVVY